MVGNNAQSGKVVFNTRFGSLRHLSQPSDDLDDITHAVKKEAASLLLDALDCLHDALAACKQGEDIDATVLLGLQHRLEGTLRMQRLLRLPNHSVPHSPTENHE